MRVTMLLADAAQAIENKLYILGGGWSITGPGPVPFAIALKIEVPWNEANIKHRWRLSLFDDDGAPVSLEGGGDPIRLEGEFEVGRPPGLTAGTTIDLALAINIASGMPLLAGRRYEWRLFIDEKTQNDWALAFSTRPR